MSPLPLRRYRAERLLSREFEGQRRTVLDTVRGRLRSRGVALDEGDLEGCYATAWQGLYTALLEGQEIENPTGWLVLVCFRRAIDEARVPARREEHHGGGGETQEWGAVEPDIAAALDDRARLQQTFEALRKGLNTRERQAATLCYLQGLTRAQAASRMGLSEARMRKLMEGHGAERPGVAAKVDGLLRTISGGGWCEQQGSLMRALAFGILDPAGERYQLAQLHRRECPACRAYVLSLRGLAAVLPPLALPWGPGAVGFGGGSAAGAGAGAGTGSGVGAASGAGTGAGAGVGSSGGSLFAGGSLGAKLAAGCLLVAGVGGGCVALVAGASHTHPAHRHRYGTANLVVQGAQPGVVSLARSLSPAHAGHKTSVRSRVRSRSATRTATVASQAQRELGFERPPTLPAVHTIRSAPPPSSNGAAREFGIE
jgi:DNA-directed RNA polymerase specialized sigma24 family protein